MANYGFFRELYSSRKSSPSGKAAAPPHALHDAAATAMSERAVDTGL